MKAPDIYHARSRARSFLRPYVGVWGEDNINMLVEMLAHVYMTENPLVMIEHAWVDGKLSPAAVRAIHGPFGDGHMIIIEPII